MEINSSSKSQEQENSSTTTSSSHNNGGATNAFHPTPPHTPTPKPITKSPEPNPFPTTFVQADTSTFKQVVQMLTGSSNSSAASSSGGGGSIPPIKNRGHKKPGFKLYERRNSLKNGLIINTLIPGFSQNSTFSPRKHEILSPSILDFPALVLSPATPLNEDTMAAPSPCFMEEERAIAQKKFYLHPSPRMTARDDKPRLLPLFPVTSPRVSGTSS